MNVVLSYLFDLWDAIYRYAFQHVCVHVGYMDG